MTNVRLQRNIERQTKALADSEAELKRAQQLRASLGVQQLIETRIKRQRANLDASVAYAKLLEKGGK